MLHVVRTTPAVQRPVHDARSTNYFSCPRPVHVARGTNYSSCPQTGSCCTWYELLQLSPDRFMLRVVRTTSAVPRPARNRRPACSEVDSRHSFLPFFHSPYAAAIGVTASLVSTHSLRSAVVCREVGGWVEVEVGGGMWGCVWFARVLCYWTGTRV